MRFFAGPPGFQLVAGATVPAPDFTRLAWLDPARIIIETCDDTCGNGHWVVDLDGTVQALPAADNFYGPCYSPATSSGPIRPDSLEVYVDFEMQEVRVRNVFDNPDDCGLDALTPEHFRSGCGQL